MNSTAFASLGDVSVYPNPATSQVAVSVKLNRVHQHVGYRLLDISGRVVYQLDKTNIQDDKFIIPTDAVSPGIYHVVFIADDELTTRQVVIAR